MKNFMISEFIPVGRENATSRTTLCLLTHLGDRDVRHMIETERLNGIPIINNGEGYYIANPEDYEDILEVRHYIQVMHAKAVAINASAGALTKWLEEVATNG